MKQFIKIRVGSKELAINSHYIVKIEPRKDNTCAITVINPASESNKGADLYEVNSTFDELLGRLP